MAEKTVLYRYFDNDDSLLYIGISKNFIVRLGQHEGDKDWSCRIVSIKAERFPCRDTALIAEYEAIKKEKPIYNKQCCDPRKQSSNPGIITVKNTKIRRYYENEWLYVDSRVKGIVSKILKGHNPTEKISDIVFIYYKNMEKLNDFIKSGSVVPDQNKFKVSIPTNVDSRLNIRDIKKDGNDLSSTMEKLFLFYEANGFKIPLDVNGK